MDPAITGCPPGGATYHSWGYKVIHVSDIFTKIAISPRVLRGFHSNVYTMFTRMVYIIGSPPGGATCHIRDFTAVLRF